MRGAQIAVDRSILENKRPVPKRPTALGLWQVSMSGQDFRGLSRLLTLLKILRNIHIKIYSYSHNTNYK